MKDITMVGNDRSGKLTKMERFKDKFVKIKSKLRRGWGLSRDHPHYSFDEDGTITKVFPNIQGYELDKIVKKWVDYPRAFRRRACKELFGTISPRIWQIYRDAEYEWVEFESR